MPHVLTLSQFVKMIQSLECEGYIRQNFTLTFPPREAVQLPFKVTCAFFKLDNLLHDPGWHWISTSPLKFFDEFLLHLVNHARNNSYAPSAEGRQAEFLLGFLLQHNLQITHNEETKSFEDSMFAQFPLNEFRYFRCGILPKSPIYIPEGGYVFLSENWRNDQNYPTIEALHECWLKNQLKKIVETEHEQQLVLLEQKKQLEIEAENTRRQQELAFLNRHCFVDVLTLEQFSYALEGFIKSGKVQFPNNGQFFYQAPVLSTSLSARIVHFAQLTRQNFLWEEKKQAFILLLKEIIATAKVHSPTRQASQLLLGFLLYHNFQIYDGNCVHKMSDIYWVEANTVEKFQIEVGQDPIPVSNLRWLKQQDFPGKDMIESLLRGTTSHYLPGYQRPAAFLTTAPTFGATPLEIKGQTLKV